MFDSPPPEICGKDLKTQLRDFGAEMTPDVGGHERFLVDAVGDLHNWHKKNIFWDLPYWEDHLLRHNLDVMHIEKNFFDNLMNTILNVQGKTKDNLKSRLNLVDICARSELHVDENGRALFPIADLMQREKMRSLIGFQTMWNFQTVTHLICVTVSTERKESLLA